MLHGNVKGDGDWDSVFLSCDEQDGDRCIFSLKDVNTEFGLYTTGNETYVPYIKSRAYYLKVHGDFTLGAHVDCVLRCIMEW